MYLKCILLILGNLVLNTYSFKSPFLTGRHTPIKKEIKVEIPLEKDSIFRNLNGFFGQIGPNPKFPSDEGYSLFDGDGMIHGTFFKKSKIVYNNHWVKTKKLITELKWGKKMYISLGEMKGIRGLTSILRSEIMKSFKIIPSGYTANTAFMYHDKKLFALHETDTPYEIYINYNNCSIRTGHHYTFKNIISTTAHPRFDNIRKHIYLYSYSSLDKDRGYFFNNVFDYKFNQVEHDKIGLINNGIIHDIGQTENNLIIPDMPLKTDLNRILDDKLPIYFDKNGTTRFGILGKDTGVLKWYKFKENFFIFHFSECFENKNEIIINACLLENVNFSSFIDNTNFKPFEGTQLVQIVLDKKSNKYKIIKNKHIEKLTTPSTESDFITEFPVKSKLNESVVYCGIVDSFKGEIHGYMKIDLKNFKSSVPEIFIMENKFGNSECQPVIIDGKEYLITYTYDHSDNYYISLIDIENKIIHDKKLPKKIRIPPGFHSIYIDKSS